MDERQALLNARDLIKAKEYDQARAILENLSANPTAQQWLAKLDELAPRTTKLVFDDDAPADPFGSSATYGATYGGFSTPTYADYSMLTDEEKFDRVKVLLKDKKYDEARPFSKH